MRDCEVPGCEEPHLARGYCVGHYARWRNGFTEEEMLLPLWGIMCRRVPPRECSVEGCDRPPRTRGMCKHHYDASRPMVGGPCEREGCDEPVKGRAKRFCSRDCAYADVYAKGERCYEERAAGREWAAIAEHLGYSTYEPAMRAARKHAERSELPWPPQAFSRAA